MLPPVKACVFDVYGTLINLEAGIQQYADMIDSYDKANAIIRMWRTKQLEYTWLRNIMQHYVSFWQVTKDALDYALTAHDMNDHSFRDALLTSYVDPECYEEVIPCLEAIKAKKFKTAILSNGSPEMLFAAICDTGMDDYIDSVLSVEEIRLFKPEPLVYQLAVDKLQLPKEDIAYFSSNAWDVAGAASFGLSAIWVNRTRQLPERLPGEITREVTGIRSILDQLSPP